MEIKKYKNDYKKVIDFIRKLYNKQESCYVPGYWNIHAFMKDPFTRYKYNKKVFTENVFLVYENNKLIGIIQGFGSMKTNPTAVILLDNNYNYLYSDIVDFAEDNLPAYYNKEHYKINIYASGEYFEDILYKKGYTKDPKDLFRTKRNVFSNNVTLPHGYHYINRSNVTDLNELEYVIKAPFYSDYVKNNDISEFINEMTLCPLWENKFELIIKHNYEYIGYITIWMDQKSSTAYIDWVGIIPKYQKKGFGKLLVNKVSNIALENGIKNIYLTYDDEPQKVGLYPNCEFKIIDIEHKFYKEF